MTDAWRIYLYSFGFLSTFLFAVRFFIQWIASELAKKSIVPRFFWQISLVGNVSLWIHAAIQGQYHVFITQTINATISWRNLNLGQPKAKQYTTRTTVAILCISCLLGTLLFAGLSGLENLSETWLRTPVPPWRDSPGPQISLLVHFFGAVGIVLFSTRFWFQWWAAESSQTPDLPLSFWWMSFAGGLGSTIYFLSLGDLVNLIGPMGGLLPYVRNLYLIYKARAS